MRAWRIWMQLSWRFWVATASGVWPWELGWETWRKSQCDDV